MTRMKTAPISRSVTVKYCPSTTLPLPTLGLDNKPYTDDDAIDDDASCSAAAMGVSSSSSKRATSPRLSFEAKQTPSSIKTFETNVSDDVTNRLLATCLQPHDAVITVVITKRTATEDIEDEDDGCRPAADANGVGQPLLNNRISDVRGRLLIGLHLEYVFYHFFYFTGKTFVVSQLTILNTKNTEMKTLKVTKQPTTASPTTGLST
jgi:hypothetical protein